MEGTMGTVNKEGFTSCCEAMTTFGFDGVECCKGCWEEVISDPSEEGGGGPNIMDLRQIFGV
jgi:hypothetical protein